MPQITTLTPLLALIGLFATAVQAQSPDDCPSDIELADLQGQYTLEIGDALVRGDGRAIALDASDQYSVTIDLRESSLYMEAGPNVIVFDRADDEDGTIDRGRFAAIAGMSAADLELTAGCELEELPVLIGGGRADSMEGTPIKFEYRFLVMGQDWMVGTLDWSGGGISSTRLAMLKAM